MLSVEEIKQIAARAADGNPGAVARFRVLAIFAGLVGRPGGWIYLPGGKRPFAHGWQAAACSFTRPGWTGRDLLVEMSKASCSADDVAAAYVEAYAEAAHREALAICASIPTAGRPAAVTELLSSAELLTDEHEHLAAVRHARAVYDEQVPARPVMPTVHGIRGHRVVTPAEDEQMRELALAAGVTAVVDARGRGHFTPLPVPAPEPVAYPGDPRADRLAASFAAFAELADSGGPGTSRGVIAAVEIATTVTESDLDRAVSAAVGLFGGSDARAVLAALGFVVK